MSSMKGWIRYFLLTIYLIFRNPQAIVYGYLVPIIFLLAFASVFRAQGRHFGDARHGLQVVAQIPILETPYLLHAVLSGGIDQTILIDPTDSGRILGQLNADAFGQAWNDGIQIFKRPRPRPVDVRAFLKDDVDVGVAEIREAADVFHFGQAQQRRGDGIRHLIFHDVRAAVPLGIDNDLSVRQIGDRIQLRVLHRVPANQHAHADEEKNDEFVLRADIDNAVNHCCWASASSSGRLRKTPPFWATNVSAAFLSLNASVPGEQRSNSNCSACLDSSILDMSCWHVITRLDRK